MFFFKDVIGNSQGKKKIKMTGWRMRGGLLLLRGESKGTVMWVADRQYLRSCQQKMPRLAFQELTSYCAATNPQIKLCEQSGHPEGETPVCR